MLSNPSPNTVIFFTLIIFALNAFELTSETPFGYVWENCPNQTAACDDTCKAYVARLLGTMLKLFLCNLMRFRKCCCN